MQLLLGGVAGEGQGGEVRVGLLCRLGPGRGHEDVGGASADILRQDRLRGDEGGRDHAREAPHRCLVRLRPEARRAVRRAVPRRPRPRHRLGGGVRSGVGARSARLRWRGEWSGALRKRGHDLELQDVGRAVLVGGVEGARRAVRRSAVHLRPRRLQRAGDVHTGASARSVLRIGRADDPQSGDGRRRGDDSPPRLHRVSNRRVYLLVAVQLQLV
mmetsp:Transcript_48051/g.135255  ORF Transcript_48051/g.135255 Transcript_48051/m.135255 type:complete len:215 (+) Transcript_48051:353-997(+)